MRRRPAPPVAGVLVAVGLVLSLSACGGGAEADGEREGNTPSASSGSSEAPRGSDSSAPEGKDASGTGEGKKATPAQPPVEAGEKMPTEDLRAMLLQAVADDGSAKMQGVQIADGTTSRTEGIYSRKGGEVALDITTTIDGGEGFESLETRTVLVDGALYSRTPGISGDSYLKTSTGAGGVVMDFSYLDPIAALEQHKDAIRDVVYVGEEKVDGKKLTRYDAAVEATAGDGADPAVGAFTYSVFFNAKGRIARAELVVGEEASTVTNYSDWGGDHTVAAPPADQVQQMPGN